MKIIKIKKAPFRKVSFLLYQQMLKSRDFYVIYNYPLNILIKDGEVGFIGIIIKDEIFCACRITVGK